MGKDGVQGFPYSRIDQVGVVVRDIEAAIRSYGSLGIGPFAPVTRVKGVLERTMRGKKLDPQIQSTRIMVARIGELDLELVQPVSGESPAMEFLQAHGEGINHFGFVVLDLEAETSALEKSGARMIFASKFANGGGARYFEIDGTGGILLEIIEWPPEQALKSAR